MFLLFLEAKRKIQDVNHIKFLDLEEESASQSSGLGYNDNLSQKNRIEEIRATVMKNISDFYTLKWIQILALMTMVATILFCIVYVLQFDQNYKNLTKIIELNSYLYQTTIWMSNLVSSLVSMRSIYSNYAFDSPSINFYTFIPDKPTYFEFQRSVSLGWYQNITDNFGTMEMNINSFLDDYTIFWQNIPTSLYYKLNDFKYYETFPFGIDEALHSALDLMKLDSFNLSKVMLSQNNFILSQDVVYKMNYSSYLIIQNVITNYLPKQIDFLSFIPQIFISYNDLSVKYIILIILVYAFLMLLVGIFYMILLFLTNQNMEEGLETVSKIKPEKIEETIKKIENFSEKNLVKFFPKEPQKNYYEDREKNEREDLNKFRNYIENTKFKSIKILTFSYLQSVYISCLIASIILPVYFISQKMIQNTNTIINIDNYIYGKSLRSSLSTINLKCKFASCNTKSLSFNSIKERSEVENMLRQLSGFTDITDFYNQQYLMDACKVLYSNFTSKAYNNCRADYFVATANNTDSIINLLEEMVFKLDRDMGFKKKNNTYTFNNTVIPYQNRFMFENSLFASMEYIFYNFLIQVTDNYSKVVSASLGNYLESNRTLIIVLISVLAIFIFFYSLWISLIYTQKLVHYLSISRCILRIIPTNVIASTNDLKSWIEVKGY